MSDLGTLALESGERIDFASMRRDRLARTLAEMERDGLDAMLLGHEFNARYVSGARRLWTVGMRPFGPGCCVIRSSASVHLLSTWDDGVPEEIPHDNLMQTSWNPKIMLERLLETPGIGDARRIGIDAMTPLFANMLPAALPKAQWVDAGPALRRARAIKTKEEVACIRTATALAEGALAAVLPEIQPGASERALTGRFHEEAALQGTPIPAFEASFADCPLVATPDSVRGPRLISQHRNLLEGDLVHCHAGILYAGYEGATASTVRCTESGANAIGGELASRLNDLRSALHSSCRPGADPSLITAAYQHCGEPLPNIPILHGVGLGMEMPVIGRDCDPDPQTLEAGNVVALYAYVEKDGLGGALARDTVLIKSDGVDSLNASPPPE
jgi:Xaa-Pro aminopeptidase